MVCCHLGGRILTLQLCNTIQYLHSEIHKLWSETAIFMPLGCSQIESLGIIGESKECNYIANSCPAVHSMFLIRLRHLFTYLAKKINCYQQIN
jgi:hypothetical protein